MQLLNRESFYLALIFIREAIYRSLSRYRVRRGIYGYFIKILMPSIDDGVLVYNLKWLLTGMMSGLFIGLWIPIVSYGSNIMGLPNISKAFTASYLIMAMLISIVIILDLIYQVTASIRDLGMTKPIEYMPIKHESIEKAASYSIIVGGGLSGCPCFIFWLFWKFWMLARASPSWVGASSLHGGGYRGSTQTTFEPFICFLLTIILVRVYKANPANLSKQQFS
ncbi:hypothetical protein Smar_0403 [Staphylothermus marinus F1]|uniref:Uncharacterized protein n=1 Tax=Staphylothermus marinus (strain ATCC 43588 / DSM 3639 / JCM 9404 / F1) TaxID=399550 RepID=A3DLK5_STAMF|nr:hypothetical protein [Staphylothermus marinus]ABN69515.1 hypothetical protein Smar_0403 [Staphylothermus marinus F1]